MVHGAPHPGSHARWGLRADGREGKIVEADETYFGKPEVAHVSPRRVADGRPYIKGNKPRNSRAIVALVERGGNVRSFHVAVADKTTVNKIVNENIARESQIHTDESQLYNDVADTFFAHETVKHTAKEYVRYWNEVTGQMRPDGKPIVKTTTITTNTVEGYFSIFKRGTKGICIGIWQSTISATITGSHLVTTMATVRRLP